MNHNNWKLLSQGEFFCYYENNKYRFINYCEVVITKDGDICLPIHASHKDIMRDLVKEYNGDYPDMNDDILDLVIRTNSICVSYDNQVMYRDFYSKPQKNAFDLLKSLRLINENIQIIK